jgi:hypothetical protein
LTSGALAISQELGIDIPGAIVQPRPVSDVTRILDRVQPGEGKAAGG